MDMKKVALGHFHCTSGRLIVTDPCYTRDTSSAIRGDLQNVKTGRWDAFVLRGERGGWGTRNAELIILADGISFNEAHSQIWMQAEGFQVGVDSGQAGFFDESIYPEGSTGDYGNESSFYGQACTLTLDTPAFAGILGMGGVVSSSGFGDGSYDCYILQNESDEIVGAKIIFIDEDDRDSGDIEIEE